MMYSAVMKDRVDLILENYEHSEQARAPRTNGPRDVPRCGALSLLQKPQKNSAEAAVGGKQSHFNAVNRHKREVNDFACGIKSRRGPPAALPGADVWWQAWCDGTRFSCAARHATNYNVFPMAVLD